MLTVIKEHRGGETYVMAVLQAPSMIHSQGQMQHDLCKAKSEVIEKDPENWTLEQAIAVMEKYGYVRMSFADVWN